MNNKRLTRKDFLQFGAGFGAVLIVTACPADDSSGDGDTGASSGDGGPSGSTNNPSTSNGTTNGTTMTSSSTTMDPDTGTSSTTDPTITGTDSSSSSGSSGSTSGSSSSSSSGAPAICGAGADLLSDIHFHSLPGALPLPAVDIENGAEMTYTLEGSGHMHSITVTAAHFAELQLGNSVVAQSGPGGLGPHMHMVTIQCI